MGKRCPGKQQARKQAAEKQNAKNWQQRNGLLASAKKSENEEIEIVR